MNRINIVKVNANGTVKGVTYSVTNNIDTADVLLHSYCTVYQVDALLNNPSHASRLGEPVGAYRWHSYQDFYDDPFQDTDRTYLYLDRKWYGFFVGHRIGLSDAVDAVRECKPSQHSERTVQMSLV